jgi:hypothetical protein
VIICRQSRQLVRVSPKTNGPSPRGKAPAHAVTVRPSTFSGTKFPPTSTCFPTRRVQKRFPGVFGNASRARRSTDCSPKPTRNRNRGPGWDRVRSTSRRWMKIGKSRRSKYNLCWSGRSNLVYDAGAAFNISADNYLMCRYVGGLSHNWESPDIWLIFTSCKRPSAYYVPLIERGDEFTFVRFC